MDFRDWLILFWALLFITLSRTADLNMKAQPGEREHVSTIQTEICYVCPEGSGKLTDCPKNKSECKECMEGRYLHRSYCTNCVKCPADRSWEIRAFIVVDLHVVPAGPWKRSSMEPNENLVEVQSCSTTSQRMCECKAGMYCKIRLQETCSKCIPHTACLPETGVKVQDNAYTPIEISGIPSVELIRGAWRTGTPFQNTECEECPVGTFSDEHSTIQKCLPHTDCAKLNKITVQQGNASWDSICEDLPESTTRPATFRSVDIRTTASTAPDTTWPNSQGETGTCGKKTKKNSHESDHLLENSSITTVENFSTCVSKIPKEPNGEPVLNETPQTKESVPYHVTEHQGGDHANNKIVLKA
nr:PREDICTED: tumor necrosis factor receptor superfamily member 21-like [Latimeria chalumnae]|eukprot:XP_014344172.1 PREDICTED: tumor necrosis factor receptor superfamily member 21-like [Latimeria chalumnae]